MSVCDARIIAQELSSVLARLLGIVARSSAQIVKVQVLNARFAFGQARAVRFFAKPPPDSLEAILRECLAQTRAEDHLFIDASPLSCLLGTKSSTELIRFSKDALQFRAPLPTLPAAAL